MVEFTEPFLEEDRHVTCSHRAITEKVLISSNVLSVGNRRSIYFRSWYLYFVDGPSRMSEMTLRAPLLAPYLVDAPL
jgi:hypothetical protein